MAIPNPFIVEDKIFIIDFIQSLSPYIQLLAVSYLACSAIANGKLDIFSSFVRDVFFELKSKEFVKKLKLIKLKKTLDFNNPNLKSEGLDLDSISEELEHTDKRMTDLIKELKKETKRHFNSLFCDKRYWFFYYFLFSASLLVIPAFEGILSSEFLSCFITVYMVCNVSIKLKLIHFTKKSNKNFYYVVLNYFLLAFVLSALASFIGLVLPDFGESLISQGFVVISILIFTILGLRHFFVKPTSERIIVKINELKDESQKADELLEKTTDVETFLLAKLKLQHSQRREGKKI